ncbi:hypothetical protein ACJJTC_016861 [Scirpophaga incertulas]
MDGNDGVGNNNNHGNTNSDQAFINRVSIRTPPFCKDRPSLWFSSLEAQFHINGITQETEPYSKLKNAIISRFSESYEEKVRRLLESEPIGDRKPSSFLRHLRSLAGPCFPEQLLETIWLNRLPRHVQLILASRKEQTLEDLWDLADQLMEITSHTPPAPVTFEVSSSQAAAPNAADFQDLNRKVEELTRAVAALTAAGPSGGAHHFHCHATSRRRNRSHSRSRSRSRNMQLCWYHDRFASKARKCEQPCQWSNNANGQGNLKSDRSFIKERRPATLYQLSAANGTNIATYGTIHLCLNLGLRRNFTWNFVVADVESAIIGSDFLAHYNLLPDCARSRLVDGTTGLVASCKESFSAQQQDDEELAEIRNSSSLKLEEIPIPGTSTNLLCDTSSGRPRPYLTPPFRRAAFDRCHNLSHPGARSSARFCCKSKMSELRLVPASNHSKPFSFVFKDLATATHVFLRDDTVRRSLQPPYSGPHCVLSRTDKTITLDLGGRQITVSIDRVKPAHIDIGSQVGTPQSSSPSPPGVTHSSPAPHPATLPASATTPLADPVITSSSSSTFPYAAHQPSAPLTSSVPTSPPLVPHPVITRAGRRVKFRDILDL